MTVTNKTELNKIELCFIKLLNKYIEQFTVQNSSDYILEGNGTPVVMLHSSMSSKEQWFRLSTNLRNTFKVIAIDLYGYGESSYPPNPSSFTLVNEASRIDSIITHLIGLDKFHLVGHSYGGATALRFTYDNPDRVISLSLFEPVAFHLLDKKAPALLTILKIVDSISACLEKKDFSTATRTFVDFWSGEGVYGCLNPRKRALLDVFIKKVLLDFQASINDPLTIADFKHIQTPVCLITSPQSPLPTRQIAHNIENALPRLVTHRVDGGHMAPIANAVAVNQIWEAFIRSA